MRGLRIWGRRVGVVGPTIVIVSLLAVFAWTFLISWRPSSETYAIQGVDVTDDTGVIDWQAVRSSGADFAYIRATQGAAGRDTLFAANWAAIYSVGMRRGAVHEFSLCRLAVDQANNFMVVVPRAGDALPAAVAIDEGSECGTPPSRTVLAGEVARFSSMIENHTGKPVLLRISPAIEAKYRLSALLNGTLWSTGSFFPPTYLSRPWRMWRANDMRRIEGADHAVGWDVVAR